jgi:hypothetical protein
LDADLQVQQFEELFNWIWDLWCQYGDDEVEFAYFGKDGWEQIRLNREEVQNNYKIVVRGNDRNTNPQTRIQKAQTILMAMNNPAAFQSGVITPINLANAYKRFYQEMEIPNWEELVSQPPPPQQPPPPIPNIKLTGDDLTEGEQAQLLAMQGIQPDFRGRLVEEEDRREEQEMQNMKDTAKILADHDIKRKQLEKQRKEPKGGE